MKLSLKRALISCVVVLAGVSLFMPVASSFAASEDTIPEATTARCEAGALGWVMCPVIKLGQEFVASMEELIVDQLDTGPIQTTGRYENLHTAWAGFRDLANVFFIGVFLVIIFAQVLNIKMDSYSIKMMLPRLIIAAIAIQFSYFIMQIGVDISNVLGNGIAGVFSSVVKGGAEGGAAMSTLDAFKALTLVGAGGALAAGTSIVTGLAVPALLLLLAGAISLLGVILTVWLRVLILQFLILLAPLAIVAWVMPNTEKWFQAWKTNVIKLLLMYPIIVFMISAGALATHITAVTAEDSNFAKILAAAVPIIVFMMIPGAIKASGSLMALTSNMVMGRMNNYSKAIRSSNLMSDSKANVKKRAGLVMQSNAKNADGINTFGQKAKAGARRGAGRVITGNMFSYGKAGQVKMAKTMDHAHHEAAEEEITWLKNDGITNPELLQIARGLGNHDQKTVTIENGYGKKKTVKLNHTLAEAAASLMIQQGGMVEFSELMDGPKVKPGETTRSGTGLFDHETGQWRTKGIQESMSRAIGPNAGKVLEKITHAVHLQGDKAYGDLKGAGVANLGAGSGITAAQQGVKWNRVNAINAVKDIVNSGALASTAQNDVMKSYRRELMEAYREGKFDGFEFDVEGYGKMDVGKFLSTFVSEGGQVTQVQGNIKQDQDAFNRILRDVLKEQEDLQAAITAARKARLNNPGSH